MRNRTKIVCTIGPASSTPEMIAALARAGMNVARLNLAHGTLESHSRTIETIRGVCSAVDQPIAILLDLPGPRYRTGRFEQETVLLEKGNEFTLTTRTVLGNVHQVSIGFPSLPEVKKGASVFLADGKVHLQVEDITGADLKCRVVVGGYLSEKRGISIPGARLPERVMAEVDREYLIFAAEKQADFVGLSFVSSAAHVFGAKKIVESHGVSIPVIAKIETRLALDNLNDILVAADGAMVARGDLGTEINVERVPIAQKLIIKACNNLGKPVITATQMLESMVASSSPTRAEAADVANAIFDGTDAVMLSEETAVGEYPVEAVSMMGRIAREIEAVLPYGRILVEKGGETVPEADDATAHAACHIALQLGAAAVVVFTSMGSTAQRVAKYRPRAPILAITPYEKTRRKLAVHWGVNAYVQPAPTTLEELFALSRGLVLKEGLGKKGDLIVITAGLPLLQPGKTNMIKIEELS